MAEETIKIHKSVVLQKGMIISKEYHHAGKLKRVVMEVNLVRNLPVRFTRSKSVKLRKGYMLMGLLHYSDNPKHQRYLYTDNDDSPSFKMAIMFKEIKKGEATYKILSDSEALLYRI